MTKRIKLLAVLAIGVLCFSGTAVAQDSTFKPHGAVNGQIFFDYSYQIGADTLGGGLGARGKGYYSSTPKDFQSFDVRRVYLGYDYWFSADVSASILLAHESSIAPPSSGAITASGVLNDGTNAFYLKGANIKWKNALPNATLIVGQQPTSSFQLTETVWGYRSIEKTLMDFRGIEGSNDMGVELQGSIDNEANFGYTAMIGNGSNQKDESNRFKKYYLDLWAKFLDKKIIIEAFNDIQYGGALATVQTLTHKGFVALQLEPITVGVEYVGQNIVGGAANVTPGGLSAFASAPIMEKTLAVFARYDMWDPNTAVTTAGFKENFITAGLDWQPTKNVHIEPNIWMDSYSDKSSANLERKADVVGRITFFAKI